MINCLLVGAGGALGSIFLALLYVILSLVLGVLAVFLAERLIV